MAKTNPLEFLQQVRNEARKVTWPSRKEVGLTTMMVFIMATLASLFFLFTDFTIQKIVTLILSVGN